MSAKKTKQIVKYSCVVLTLLLMILAVPVFAKGERKAKGSSAKASNKSSKVKTSSPAQKKNSSTRAVNRTPAIRTTIRSSTKRPVISGSSPGISRSTVRSTGISSNRSNTAQKRQRSATQIRTYNIRSAPKIAVSSSRISTTVSRPRTSSSSNNIRSSITSGKTVKTSTANNNRVSTSKSTSIGRNIGQPKASAANRNSSTIKSKQTNIISPQKSVKTGITIGKPNTSPARTEEVNKTRKATISINSSKKAVVGHIVGSKKQNSALKVRTEVTTKQKTAGSTKTSKTIDNKRTRIGANIGLNREDVIKKQIGSVSKTAVGRDPVKKSRVGDIIGGKKDEITKKGEVYIRKPGNTVSTGGNKSSVSSDKRSIVLKKGFDERSVPKRTVQAGKQGDRASIGKPVIGKGIEQRDSLDKSTLVRRDSSLQRRPSVEKSRNIRARTENRLEQRKQRKGIVVKNLEYGRGRRSSRVIYQDRPYGIRHINHNEYVYRDRYNNLCNRLIWPRYRFWVSYRWGNDLAFSYVHPYYHRKYVFVSLSGYWPIGYRYVRYYWYPWHVYRWYGYYPVGREIVGDTYNYYTYNYYNYYSNDSAEGYSTADIPPVDESTFADVRAKLAQQAADGPEEQSLADKYFEEGVKAFELGGYGYSADKFAQAMELAPDDVILPFAYVQTLFAVENYSESAELLRKALEKVSPEKEGVFYPRGLYPDDDVLFGQIEKLSDKANLYSFDSDIQLLLGYQLLGIGETDEAEEQLFKASQDMTNAPYALKLLEVLARVKEKEIEESEIIEKEEDSEAGLRSFPMNNFVEGLEKWKTVIYRNWLYAWFWRA